MPDPLQYFLWLLSTVLQAAVVVSSIVRRDSRKHFALAVYMLATVAHSVGAYFVLQKYGLKSVEYKYFYNLTDCLLVVILFIAIISLCEQVLQELTASRYVRGGAVLLILLTSLFSFVSVQSKSSQMAELKLVGEIGQNLYFVGVVMTYLLWGAVMQLRETRLRVLQFVFSLGIYFSMLAATYALGNLFPASRSFLRWIPQLASVFLAGAWTYTILMVPEGARLATARIASAGAEGK